MIKKMTAYSGDKKLPSHVGIIMDGNRRWAKNHGLPAASGHSKGAEVFKNISKYANKIELKHLTVFAFSTENWKRSAEEVSALMFLFKRYLKSAIRDFKSENMQLKFLGDISKFSPDIKNLISTIEKETQGRSGLKLNIAINYGSRAEIVTAVKTIARKVVLAELNPEDITEETVSENLYTKDQPDIDLIIRTAGEQRLSNFMLWQCAYAEFYYSDTLWPDFSEDDFNKSIDEYFNRTRRFGGE